MSETQRQTRPGGRTEKNRRAVAAAVLELITEGNLDFEFQDVAARSGVHRTTIFRRWGDRGALIAAAMAEHVSRVSIPLGGDIAKDIESIAFGMRDFLQDPVELAMNRMLAISDNAAFHEKMEEYWEPILQRFADAIESAKRDGQVEDDVDSRVVIEMVIASILTRVVFTRATWLTTGSRSSHRKCCEASSRRGRERRALDAPGGMQSIMHYKFRSGRARPAEETRRS